MTIDFLHRGAVRTRTRRAGSSLAWRAATFGWAVLLAGATGGCRSGGVPADPVLDAEPASLTLTAWSEASEVFADYSPIIAGETGTPWVVHVTRLNDSKPITEGRLILRFLREGIPEQTFTSDAPVRAGIFDPAPSLQSAGEYQLVIEVESPQLTDHIEAGTVVAYANAEDVPVGDASGGAISFLKEQQWAMEFAVVRAGPRTVARTVPVSGTLQAAAGQLAVVAAPVSGLLLVNENLEAPAPGDPVREGQTVAMIAPSVGDHSYAQAKAAVERLGREAARMQRLYDAEAVAEQRLIEAQHDLEVAEAAFGALGGSLDDGYIYPVRAPITGVISSRAMVPGGRVDAGETLFTIVNPAEVWLRLNVPARHAALANAISGVVFTVEGHPDRFETRRVVSVGSVLDSDARTVPVLLEVDNRSRQLTIGLFVEGFAFVGGESEGLALPNEAIQLEDGQAVAYVQVGGESFERRLLALGATDGIHTQVSDGLESGEYVVTKGAHQVYLASLNTSELSDHGHAH